LAVVFDVLCNPRSQTDCDEKSEAAGLLAQITSPWLDPPMEEIQNELVGEGETHSSGIPASSTWPTLHLTPYISSFVAALTGNLSKHLLFLSFVCFSFIIPVLRLEF
jgi:hypothetical protein